MGIQERKERERERRRQQIMMSAKRLFSAKGFHRTTMEDIAREAELSPGTIYLYFKNKEDLYASLSLWILQYLLIRLEHVVKAGDVSHEEKITHLKDALYDVYEFDPLILVNMFHLQSSETLKNLSPQLLSQINEMTNKSLAMMARIFKNGIKADILHQFNPDLLADTVWSLFTGIVLLGESKRITQNEDNYVKRRFTQAFELLLRGIQS